MPVEALSAVTLLLAMTGVALAVAIIVRLARFNPWSQQQVLEVTLGRLEQRLRDEFARGREESATGSKLLREEVIGAFGSLADGVRSAMSDLTSGQRVQFDGFADRLNDSRSEAAGNAKALREEVQGTLKQLGDRLAVAVTELAQKSESQQEALRTTVEGRLDVLRSENAEKLELMRQTVDEKLQGTLEQRLGASFKMVNDSLTRVHESVGEMQVLATGVGDLKRILSNVKSRGTWGEVALGNILEEILSADQYARNVEVRPRSNQRVEFAVKLPGDGQTPLWLPVDAKYPTEDYDRLVEATERGDIEAAEVALRGIDARVRSAAKDICTKYVAPPHSTDFAVMFLPTEGLFAEVIRRPGLVDALQREFQVMVAGPTTLVSLLTSLRMGFRTLAIQQRSSEVWRVLSAVKTEFEKFGGILDKVHKKLEEAQQVVEDAGVRRRAMDRKLRGVEILPEAEASALLELVAAPAAFIEEARAEAAE
jgi:DNA recombination protein RmuC